MEQFQPNQPSGQTLRLLGDYWSLRILQCLQTHSCRYRDLQRNIPEATAATLTNRLKRLGAAGFIVRTEQSRADVRYALSELGRRAAPAVIALTSFAAAADALKQHQQSNDIKQKHDARRRVGYRVY